MGYPEIGKRLMAGCLEAVKSSALVGIQDMGAAGLTSLQRRWPAAGQALNCSWIWSPQSEENMTAYEMMLSESQERMLLVAERGRNRNSSTSSKHGIQACVVGAVTDDQKLRLWHRGELKAEVPVAAWLTMPVYQRTRQNQPITVSFRP